MARHGSYKQCIFCFSGNAICVAFPGKVELSHSRISCAELDSGAGIPASYGLRRAPTHSCQQNLKIHEWPGAKWLLRTLRSAPLAANRAPRKRNGQLRQSSLIQAFRKPRLQTLRSLPPWSLDYGEDVAQTGHRDNTAAGEDSTEGVHGVDVRERTVSFPSCTRELFPASLF